MVRRAGLLAVAAVMLAGVADAQYVRPARMDETGWLAMGAPAGATTGCVGVFLGSPLNLQCDAGISYDAATDTLTSGRVLVGDGTAAAPGVALASAPGTGFYKFGSFLATTVNGTRYFTIGTTYSEVVPGMFWIGTTGGTGLSSPSAATLQLGAANAASPVAQVLKFQDATGTNANAAATATVKCPAGTGKGTPGACVFQAPVGGSSGSTAHTQTDALKIIGAESGGVPGVVLAATQSPASNAACTAGTITWDASYIYICTASGAWKRAALTGGY